MTTGKTVDNSYEPVYQRRIGAAHRIVMRVPVARKGPKGTWSLRVLILVAMSPTPTTAPSRKARKPPRKTCPHPSQPRYNPSGKLSFSLGLYLGWLGWGQVFLGGFLAFLLGALVGVGLIATGIKGRKDFVPFGPFLALGTLITVLWGSPILRWYTGS